MIEGDLLRVAALSDVYAAERRPEAAKWRLDHRLAEANSGGHRPG